MSYGITAQIRVNTRNVQLALAMARKIGMDVEKESFASIISAVLSSSLDSWVELGALTEPDPFAYNREAARFEGGKNSRDRQARSKAALRMAEHGGRVPTFLRPGNSISAPSQPTQAIPNQGGGVVQPGVWTGERGGLMSPDDGLQGEVSPLPIEGYPADQTEAHELASDDALAQRYLALHTRREAGGLTEGEQAEYLRLNHLLFDGK